MGNTSGLMQRSFGGGELAPALHARADQVKYTTGLRTCKNFVVRKAGGVSNRAGTRYVAACKTASPTVQLIPYLSELAGESILIECGAGYLRFFKEGAPVLVDPAPAAYAGGTAYHIGDLVSDGGSIWYRAGNDGIAGLAPPDVAWFELDDDILEVPTGFASDLPYWSQSGRVITLTHEDHPPQELIYVGLQQWILRGITTAPGIAAPLNLALAPGAAGTRKYGYVVTAAAADSYEESEASGQVVNANVAEPTPDLPNVLTWDDPAAIGLPMPAEYYVYCDPYGNGIYGFIGTAAYLSMFGTTIQFIDAGFVPDFGVTPPLPQVKFATSDNYPRVSAAYKQRRFFGYTNNDPEAIFASRIGFTSNFGISSPLQDDDALTFRIVGNQHNPVRHLVGLKQLIVLTDAGEWNVQGAGGGALTPSSIDADQQTYVGAHATRPVVVGNSIIYVQARGAILRDLQFDQAVEGLAGRDLTVFSSHLFGRTKALRALTYQQTPESIIWAVREDGVLLGNTYLREQEVWGWHRHTTDGFFWDACVVPEDEEDALYVIVRRTINGATVRYIERMASREIVVFNEDAFFVDCGLSYHGAAVNNIGGLQHLQGKVVAVVGNGAVVFNGDPAAPNANSFRVTAAGTLPVALPASYADIHAGLPIRFAEIETLSLDVQGAAVRDKKKRIAAIDAILEASSRSFWAGPDAAHLRQVQIATFEPSAASSPAADVQVEINLTAAFDKYGRTFIRQVDPLPLTILGIIPQVELGG